MCSVKLTHASAILQSNCLMGLQSLVSLIFLILKHVLLWHLTLGLSYPSFPCLWPILYSSVHLMPFPTTYCLRQVFLQCSLSVLSSAKAFYHTTLTFKSMQWSPFSSLLEPLVQPCFAISCSAIFQSQANASFSHEDTPSPPWPPGPSTQAAVSNNLKDSILYWIQ